MPKVLLSIKNRISKKRKQKGISMVSLVITIIVMLILAAVAFGSSLRVTSEADYAKYTNNLSEVNDSFNEKSLLIKGELSAQSNQKNMEQVYNYVAKAGKTDDDFLLPTQVPSYTILKNDNQLEIDLPELIVESGTGKRVVAKYAATKAGNVFIWPPYLYEEKLYITKNDTVDHKMQTTITVGKETFEIELDPLDGSLLDIEIPEVNTPEYENPSNPSKPSNPSEPPEEQPKEHDFSEKHDTEEYLQKLATCTQPATYYYKCVNCSEKGTETYQSGVALGHSMGEWSTTKNATCSNDGEMKRSCARCGIKETQNIERDSNKHNSSGIFETIKSATCKEEGLKVMKCTLCATILSSESIDKVEHSFGAPTVSKEATCIEFGEKQKICSVCEEKQIEQIDKNSQNHPENKIVVETQSATCIREGEKITRCSACSTIIKTESTSKTSHTFGDFKTVTTASCTVNGMKEKKCKICGLTQTETIEALGHIDTSPADNICDRCGVIIKEVPGLGDVEVDDPNLELEYNPGTGDASGVVPPGADDIETPPTIPEDKLPETIEFQFGKFEENTKYTPGTYQTVPYEETYTTFKFPVTYQDVIWSKWNVTKDAQGNITKVVAKEIELIDIDKKYSTYILYDFETTKFLEMEGVKGDSVEIWTIYNSDEDSKENIVYLAAFLNQSQNNPNRHVAKWDGSKYVAVDYDAEINAIDTFTETKTVTKTKQVLITAPTSTTEYIYVPSGTLKAEKGMTWSEWLKSEYNTTGMKNVSIKTSDYIDVSNDSVITTDKEYGFVLYELSGVWTFNDVINEQFPSENDIEFEVKYTAMRDGGVAQEFALMRFCCNAFIYYVIDDGSRYSDGSIRGEEIFAYENSPYGWTAEYYKDINFGTTPQAVSKEFYEWFTANANQYTLSDKWVFNETVYYANRYAGDGVFDLNFTSNGKQFDLMMMEEWGVLDGFPYYLFYYSRVADPVLACGWDIPQKEGEEFKFFWRDEAYRMVDLGTTPQSVPKQFFDWFISNAKKCAGLFDSDTNELLIPWDELIEMGKVHVTDGEVYTNADTAGWDNGSYYTLSDKLLVLPDDGSITRIDDYGFYYTGLDNVVVPSSVTSIGKEAFSGMGTGSFVMPDSVTSMGDMVFHNTYFENVTLGKGIGDYGAMAFNDSEILKSVKLNEYIASGVDAEDFVGCINLEKIIIPENNNSYCSVDGVVYSKDMKTLICYPLGKTDTTFTIPNSVTTIEPWAFGGDYREQYTELETVTIGENVTKIKSRAFMNYRKLKNLIFEGTVEQWNKITLEDDWYIDIPATKVTCSNGTVSLK